MHLHTAPMPDQIRVSSDTQGGPGSGVQAILKSRAAGPKNMQKTTRAHKHTHTHTQAACKACDSRENPSLRSHRDIKDTLSDRLLMGRVGGGVWWCQQLV